jgi:hypothetical protein
MSTIEYHYQTIGRILAHLINRGLSRVDLHSSDAMEIMTERRGSEGDVLATFADCIHWMRAEGLIRVSKISEKTHGNTFFGLQLTSAGIALIRTDPQDAELGDSIEKRVTESEGADLGSSIYTKIGEFVGSAIGGLTRSLGGG